MFVLIFTCDDSPTQIILRHILFYIIMDYLSIYTELVGNIF